MKKLIYGTILLAFITVGVFGCKKDYKYPIKDSNIEKKSNIINVPFTKNGDILVFESWEDVNDLTESLEKSLVNNIFQFEA